MPNSPMFHSIYMALGKIIDQLGAPIKDVPDDIKFENEINELYEFRRKLGKKIGYIDHKAMEQDSSKENSPPAEPTINSQLTSRSAELEEGVRLLRLWRKFPPQTNWRDFKDAYNKCTYGEQQWFQSKFREDEWDMFAGDEEVKENNNG